VQEALNNVVKHAHAGAVPVSVRRDRAMVQLTMSLPLEV